MHISKETECNCCGEMTDDISLLHYKRIMLMTVCAGIQYTKAYIVCERCRDTLSIDEIAQRADRREKGKIIRYERFNGR